MSNQLPPASTQLATFQLFFGRHIRNINREVSGSSWDQFVFDIIDPLFDGYTIQTAKGVWQGQSETTMILSVCCSDSRWTRELIQDIAEAYKTRFHQDSVGLLVLPPISFL